MLTRHHRTSAGSNHVSINVLKKVALTFISSNSLPMEYVLFFFKAFFFLELRTKMEEYGTLILLHLYLHVPYSQLPFSTAL